jgi:hypothetical protein
MLLEVRWAVIEAFTEAADSMCVTTEFEDVVNIVVVPGLISSAGEVCSECRGIGTKS